MMIGQLLARATWSVGWALVAGGALVFSREGRPLLRGAIVTALAVSDRVRGVPAVARERLEDIYQEAYSEYAAMQLPSTNGHPPIPRRQARPRNGRPTTATNGNDGAPSGGN